MTRNDYILLYTSRLLLLPEPLFTSVLEEFASRFEIHELKKSGSVSIGGHAGASEQMSYAEWLNTLRAENIQELRFFYHVSDNSVLAPHIAHAFAGSQELMMMVVTEQSSPVYTIQTMYSPQNEITAAQFKELIDTQSNPDVLWKRIGTLILESNQLNNGPLFDIADIRDVILKGNEVYSFDFMASQLLSEVQLEANINGSEFIVPESFKHLLYQSDSSSFGSLFGDDEDKMYVYLYPLKDVTGKELLALIEAQPISAKDVWLAAIEESNLYVDPTIPKLSETEWPLYIQDKNGEECRSIASIVCRAIAKECERLSIDKTIPADLAESFGPDAMENKRAQARSSMHKNQWMLSAPSNPWELYFFEQAGTGPVTGITSETDSRKQFIQTMHDMYAFAKRINSPFQEAFGLSLYLSGENIPAGSFNPEHMNTITSDLKTKDFSDRAIRNFEDVFYYGEIMHVAGMSTPQIYALLAVTLCSNIFGGMGSWNDQYMENEADQELYQRLSGDAFKYSTEYFAAVLSGTKK